MVIRAVLYGGSFSPPTITHQEIARRLGEIFDIVFVIPCGIRNDGKNTTNDIDPMFRAIMADLAFRNLPNVFVDLFDLENTVFTRAIDLEKRYLKILKEKYGEDIILFHAVGSEQIKGGAQKNSPIHKWKHGNRVFDESNIIVIKRASYDIDEQDLPPNNIYYDWDLEGSSTDVRFRLSRHSSVSDSVPREVDEFMQRYGLYRNVPRRKSKLCLTEPRMFIVPPDPLNYHYDQITEFLNELDPYSCAIDDNPNLIVVLGGDGTMLRAIKQYWRHRIPFYGINFGKVGFLLNDTREYIQTEFPKTDLDVYQLPLIYAEWKDSKGNQYNSLAFNDVYLERSSFSAANIQVLVDGISRIDSMYADMVLFSSAPGSTAYARSMGAAPIPAHMPMNLLVASNATLAKNNTCWKSAPLDFDSQVCFVSLSPKDRPMRPMFDGRPPIINDKAYEGDVVEMRVRLSQMAGIELAFSSGHSLVEKLTKIYFP